MEMDEKKIGSEQEQSISSYEAGQSDNAKLGFINTIASKLKAETKGIELVTDEEKVGDSLWNAASMWLSANMVIATYSLGALGVTVFGLSFWTSVLTIIFFNMLGVISVGFFSIFGARLGLRQILLSKFLVGNWTMRIFALINAIACVGWGAVNIMSSAQLISIVNNQACPPWVACLILVILTILVTFFGYHVIHVYEKWAWIPNVAIFIAIIARMKIAGTFTAGEFVSGTTTAAGVLSFGGTVFGYATGWTTLASDYTVYQPRNINSLKIFFSVYAGLLTPCIFAMILGAACATGTLTNERWAELYHEYSIGGLVYAVLVEDSLGKFGEFLCVLLALSTVSNNIPNMYSIGLSTQAIWSGLIKIPRVAWTIIGNFVTLAICIPAYYHFVEVVDQFMTMIGYYLAIYEAIAFSEHFFYNKGKFSAYDYENHKDPKSHPIGYAGTVSFFAGVAGAVLGMSKQWFTGPLAKLIGPFGADIGFELSFAFTFVVFNALRPLEKKYVGR
ncbi:purine-cytosine permease Fcy2p [[Candida] jaroonii]|uniref:Purine-cytosine permease Fcy2p n=1 Tax=[Candida] jaroonii TaxID=467808 RepID=A0ACA9Y1C0_9ASCO|nr:purine-cytosine permease Fcy2p [[Candida] jaroonii]